MSSQVEDYRKLFCKNIVFTTNVFKVLLSLMFMNLSSGAYFHYAARVLWYR